MPVYIRLIVEMAHLRCTVVCLFQYKEAGDVDGLVSPLTAILDTSHKATLFDGIK